MTLPVRLTLLVDHAACRPDLETEHGWSVLLEAGTEVVLFDGGTTEAAFRNAERLGLPWRRITHIVASHGHRDHTRGLRPFLEALPHVPVYLHPRALGPKFTCPEGARPRELSMPEEVQRVLLERRERLQLAVAPMRLGPGLGLTGPIPRRHAEEHHSGPFYQDPNGQLPDPLEDDLALWVDTPAGGLVLLGCAHAGVLNTLDHLASLRPGWRPRMLVGGLHLISASEARIQATLEGLRARGVAQVVPTHCTGTAATEALGRAFGGLGQPLRAGDSLLCSGPVCAISGP